MTVFRKMPQRFVAVDNGVARDQRLSFRARGVLVYMLSLPDGAQFSADRLAKEGQEGRRAILTALEELRAAGYYRSRRERVSKGQFVTVTEVSSDPIPEWIGTTEVRLPNVGPPNFGESTSSTEDQEQHKEQDQLPTTCAAPSEASQQQFFDEEQQSPQTVVVTVPENPPKVRPRNVLFDAVLEVCDGDGNATRSAASLIAKVARELAEVGATPEEVRVRGSRYRERYAGMSLTPSALAKHWNALSSPLPTASQGTASRALAQGAAVLESLSRRRALAQTPSELTQGGTQ